jgi:hypothetical protein
VSGANSNLPIGFYPGPTVGLTRLNDYETFIGRQVDYVLTFMPSSPTWAQYEAGNLQGVTNGPGGANNASDWAPLLGSRRMMIATPACVQGTTWAQEAAGVNDAHHRALATNLVAAGLGNSLIRLAREMNAGYPWAVTPSNASDHKAGWIHIVNVFKSVTGANFKFCWNPIIGQGPFGPNAGVESAYPDQGTVDVIGLDVYDWGYAVSAETIRAQSDQATFFANQLSQWDGLTGWRSFAQSRNLSLCFPEWGLKLWGTGNSYNGGGDNPYFVQHMASFMKASSDPTDPLAMAAFWEDAGQGVFDPDNYPARRVEVPNSRAMFLKEFGSS